MVHPIAVALLAHQGGWDEVLLVVGPLVALAGIVILAKARIDETAGSSPPDDDSPAGDLLS